MKLLSALLVAGLLAYPLGAADNISVTAGSGTTVGADEVTDGTLGSVKVQMIKIMDATIDGTNKASVSAGGALKVDNSAVTQPVSGTITANQGTQGYLVTSTNTLNVTVATALPAGTNGIGKLTANSGVDIGDVDVTSLPALPAGTNAIGLVSGSTVTVLTNAGGNLPVAATQSGTWNVGTVTAVTAISNALPVGTNNIGTVTGSTVTVLTTAGTNLPVSVNNTPSITGTVTANQGTQGYLITSTNTLTVGGVAAHDAVVSGSPVLAGAEARQTLGTAVANGDVVRIAADRYGRLIVTRSSTTIASSSGTAISAAGSTTVVAAPAASSHLKIRRLHATNAGSTATFVYWAEGTGPGHYPSFLPQYGIISLNIGGSWELPSATALNLRTTAAGSVQWTVEYDIVAD